MNEMPITMERLKKLMPELNPKRFRKNIERFWKIHVDPPKERAVFLRPETLPIVSTKVSEIETAAQPKQVVVDEKTGVIFVSCMEGRRLQCFTTNNGKLELIDEVKFTDQCVEVLTRNGIVFATTTNFDRPPRELRNKLWVVDAESRGIISQVDTGGNWSKLIAIRPQGDELLISNWHSHDVSVIDIRDSKNPVLRQILKWGEAPRGIAFLPNGNTAVVTGFYSGNLGVLGRAKEGKWYSVYTGDPYDPPNYPGNMRHVLIDKDGDRAIVSNLGRNLVHVWDIDDKKFLHSIPVGKSPNSIDFWGDDQLVVSCRDSSVVYFLNLKTYTVTGRSQKTGKEPTGLCATQEGFLVTCFKDNKIELHKVTGY